MKAVVVLLLIGISFHSISQSAFNSGWIDYNHSNKLKNNWVLEADYGYRFRLNYKYNWQRIHARAGVGYKFENVKILAGVALFNVFEPKTFLDLEIRPWQGAKYNWPEYRKFKISHFVRLEERFHFFAPGSEHPYNYFLMVFRYSLTAKYSFNNPEDGKGKWVGFVGFEPFYKLYENKEPIAVSKSRTTAGLTYSFSKKSHIKLAYIYQPTNIPIVQNTEVYSNIIRVSMVQKF
jgi:hypothetical protein